MVDRVMQVDSNYFQGKADKLVNDGSTNIHHQYPGKKIIHANIWTSISQMYLCALQ